MCIIYMALLPTMTAINMYCEQVLIDTKNKTKPSLIRFSSFLQQEEERQSLEIHQRRQLALKPAEQTLHLCWLNGLLSHPSRE